MYWLVEAQFRGSGWFADVLTVCMTTDIEEEKV